MTRWQSFWSSRESSIDHRESFAGALGCESLSYAAFTPRARNFIAMFSRNDARHTMYLSVRRDIYGGGGKEEGEGVLYVYTGWTLRGNENRARPSVWSTSTIVTSAFSLSKRTPTRNHGELVSTSITFATSYIRAIENKYRQRWIFFRKSPREYKTRSLFFGLSSRANQSGRQSAPRSRLLYFSSMKEKSRAPVHNVLVMSN